MYCVFQNIFSPDISTYPCIRVFPSVSLCIHILLYLCLPTLYPSLLFIKSPMYSSLHLCLPIYPHHPCILSPYVAVIRYICITPCICVALCLRPDTMSSYLCVSLCIHVSICTCVLIRICSLPTDSSQYPCLPSHLRLPMYLCRPMYYSCHALSNVSVFSFLANQFMETNLAIKDFVLSQQMN